VDEMIIVDTGSTDRTQEIAQEFDAKIFNYQWNDSFADARNFSLQKATGDWILVLDADEVIAFKDHQALRELISNSQTDLYYLIQTTYSQDSSLQNWVPNTLGGVESAAWLGFIESPLIRLFKNNNTIKFHGRIHENIAIPSEFPRASRTKIRIHHYGAMQSGVQKKQKNKFYKNLSFLKTQEEPFNPMAWKELGVVLFQEGSLEKSKYCFQKVLELLPKDPMAHLSLAQIASEQGQWMQAIRYYFDLLVVDPNIVEAYIYLPSLLSRVGKFDVADRLIGMSPLIVRHYPFFYLNCAILERNRGNWRKVLEYTDYVAKVSRESFQGEIQKMTLFQKALALIAIESMEEAEELLLQLKPFQEEIDFQDAQILFFLKQKNWESALEWLNRALTILPGDTHFCFQKILCLTQLGQKTQACAFFENTSSCFSIDQKKQVLCLLHHTTPSPDQEAFFF